MELNSVQNNDPSKTRDSKAEECTPLQTNLNAKSKWRNLVAYWLLGLCNNYGYVVMLSAAHDILSHNVSDSHNSEATTTPAPFINSTVRDCNQVSTGAILLADIIPSLLIKLMAPFFPFHVHLRMMAVILLSASGFLLVALSSVEWLAILGVISTSLASGLGEVTLLSYSSLFDKNVVSTWSSGTGGAGIFGAISYAGLTGLGVTPVNSLLIMLVVPALMAFTFWILLKRPEKSTSDLEKDQGDANGQEAVHDADVISDHSATKHVPTTFMEKVREVPTLLKFMIPLGAVYLFEYFINQGLFEMVEFRGISLDHHEQYRWLQVDYQVGVFISRSSVNLITISHIWVMAVLQLINVIIFTFEVVYMYIPNIWIVFAFVLWEGLLGGAAYVNTFYKISKEVPIERREFSMGITSLADAMGIALAGFISIPAHNALCLLPYPAMQS